MVADELVGWVKAYLGGVKIELVSPAVAEIAAAGRAAPTSAATTPAGTCGFSGRA